MLNPDGVVNGNYRCNLSGSDLNRQWPAPDAALHGEVAALKKLMQGLAREGKLVLFCDLHGHSNKRGVFMYCCDAAAAELPALVSRRSPFFSLTNCTYKCAAHPQGLLASPARAAARDLVSIAGCLSA